MKKGLCLLMVLALIGTMLFVSCDQSGEQNTEQSSAEQTTEQKQEQSSEEQTTKAETEQSSEEKTTELENPPADFSKGLAFESNGDGTCSVSGLGTCTDTNIVIPEISPKGDKVICISEEAFYGCSNLTSIRIPDSVIIIGFAAFYGCDGIIRKDNGVSYVNNWVIGCDETVNSVDLTNVKGIAGGAFNNCVNITNITMHDGMEIINYMAFYNCTGLTNITIPDSVKTIGYSAFEKCSNLSSVEISEGVTNIEDHTFYRCSALTNVVILGEINRIGDSAFWGCKQLTSVNLPESVTIIGNRAFYACSNLNNVILPDSVISIGEEAFWCCSRLSNITIPSSVNYIGQAAFGGCASLTSIEVVKANSTYHSINNCLIESATNVLIRACSDSVIPDGVTRIEDYAYYACLDLTRISIPESVNFISCRAFDSCPNLISITVEKGNETYHSMNNCLIETATNTVVVGCSSSVIPEGATGIGEGAFQTCIGITSIIIPKSIKSIGLGAFYHCDKLTDVYFSGSEEEWKNIEIDYDNEVLATATIHYNYVSEE